MKTISIENLKNISGGNNMDNSIDIEAGPIWNNEHAIEICESVCNAYSENYAWNGQWTTTVWNEMSVCGCYPVA